MNFRVALSFLALSSALAAPALADAHHYSPGEIKRGQHVMAEPTEMNHWIPCTVTAVNPLVINPSQINTYSVTCNGVEYSVPATDTFVRPGGPGAGASHNVTANQIHSPSHYVTKEPSLHLPMGTGPLRNGTYHCKAGLSTLMLTYGDITISGNTFRFRAPDGSGGAGTYSIGADGSLHWHGDLGAISRPPAQIIESGKDAAMPTTFHFRYRPHPGTSQTLSCRML